MKKVLFLLLVPSLAWTQCSVSDVLPSIRPNAEWSMTGTAYDGINWIDAVQIQPTLAEVQQAQSDCLAALTPTGILSGQRNAAVSELNVDPSGNAKFIRAVFLVELDEINLIRSLLVPAQTPRTITQFKNAVSQKINSGAAD